MSQTRISLLVKLLKSFTEKELINFGEFIESTYFNKEKKLIELLKKIKRYALNADKFTPELQLKVYRETFGDITLKQKELTKKQYMFFINKQNKLLRLAEQFLMIENFNNKPNTKSEFLYRILTDRNQLNLYQRHLKSDLKTLNNESKRGIKYYAHQYKIQEAQLYFLINKELINKEDNYDELHYYLDTNYILEKLKYHLAQLTLAKVYQHKNFKKFSLQSIATLLKEKQYAENPLIQLYLNNINLINTQSDVAYNNLKKTLALNKHQLPALFQRVFYTNLNNYCTAKIKTGNTLYYNNLFDNYKTMHENNLLLYDGFVDIILLKNVVTVSCFVKKFDWADKLLETYKKFVLPDFRESVYAYNKGVIAYNKKEFDLAQDWFLKVKKINETLEIDLRIFLLQCIFEIEQDYAEATKQSFESTKQFFKRNKYLSDVNKKSYLNFISIFMYLYLYKHHEIKMPLKKVLNKLNQMQTIYKKQWLLDKIAEFKD